MSRHKVIYVTTQTPAAVGHGGTHRSYQILLELQQIVGLDNVSLFTKHQLLAAATSSEKVRRRTVGPYRKLNRWISHRAGTTKRLLRNPYRLIQRTQFATGIHPNIRDYYEGEIQRIGAAVCLLEHAEFGDLISINQKYGIPTISCTQNLDAFSQNFDLISSYLARDGCNVTEKQNAGFYAGILDFANELRVLAKCNERLFISKLETGLIGAFGLTADYYPYVPVGAIRSRLMSVREKREVTKKDEGLFLLIGTATYEPIKKSCEWFINQTSEHGLPQGVRVIVVGTGTDTLFNRRALPANLELKGWIEQDEMDELLTRVRAVIVPQRFGFGTPTRLAELSCAGLPTVGDRHVTYAIDPPPGVSTVDSDWANWQSAMEQLRREDICISAGDYLAWETAQPKPLAALIEALG